MAEDILPFCPILIHLFVKFVLSISITQCGAQTNLVVQNNEGDILPLSLPTTPSISGFRSVQSSFTLCSIMSFLSSLQTWLLVENNGRRHTSSVVCWYPQFHGFSFEPHQSMIFTEKHGDSLFTQNTNYMLPFCSILIHLRQICPFIHSIAPSIWWFLIWAPPPPVQTKRGKLWWWFCKSCELLNGEN